MSKVPTYCVPVIYVCFPLASCVSHVPRPNELATYRATCKAWLRREAIELSSNRTYPNQVIPGVGTKKFAVLRPQIILRGRYFVNHMQSWSYIIVQ
jgi:hypothetical protein